MKCHRRRPPRALNVPGEQLVTPATLAALEARQSLTVNVGHDGLSWSSVSCAKIGPGSEALSEKT